MTHPYKYTVDACTSEKRWSISSHSTRAAAIRYAMKRIRRRHGTVKVYVNNTLIWKRG
jgi:hypothetical protein